MPCLPPPNPHRSPAPSPDGPDNMALTVNGQNSTSFPAGSNLTLLCSGQSSPAAQLRWAVRGVLVDAAGPLLQLSTVSQEQSGDYTCLAFNGHTNARSSITKRILVTGGSVCNGDASRHISSVSVQLCSLSNHWPLLPPTLLYLHRVVRM